MSDFICTGCGKHASIDTLSYKCDCGGLYKLNSDAPKFNPALVDQSEFSIFRYRRFMGIDTAKFKEISMGEGLTASVKFGENLYLKLDYAMPTLSFKDRGAAVLVLHAKNIGVKKVLQDSSGNAGNAVAAYCARAGIECEIYVPKGTSPKKIDMIKSHGAHVTVFDGSRDETADACRKKAAQEQIYYANHVYNPIFYEGTKSYIYEIYEQLGRVPRNIFIPVGNGTLLLGAQAALGELYEGGLIEALPKIFIVQGERCAPLFDAKGAAREIEPQPTLAEGIAIARPMRAGEILGSSYVGEREVILASEGDILPARAALACGGFYVEHTTAATYAAYLRYKESHDLQGDSIIPLCGAGLKSDH
nr:threonine synthase [uncultured Campylobacter sp.]